MIGNKGSKERFGLFWLAQAPGMRRKIIRNPQSGIQNVKMFNDYKLDTQHVENY